MNRSENDLVKPVVIALMQDPATHGGAGVERIDTHGAIVFLAGDRAYKLKRSVRFPYMDYGTLERRRTCSAAEVWINRRTAPTVYLGVAPIVQQGDMLSIGPMDPLDGNSDRPPNAPTGAAVVDWLVVMRRFDRNLALDALADRHQLGPEIIAALSEHVATFHADAPISSSPRLGAPAIRSIVSENIDELRSSPLLFPPQAVEQLAAGSRSALERHADLLDERLRRGFVRRCHGDMHLRNAVLLDGHPILFDAIEFDEDMATIDTFYDIAFLLMDLDHRGLRPLAHLAMQRYLDHTDDLEGLATMPLFLATRAAVRAKVTASIAQVQSSMDHQSTLQRDARFYLAGALDALRPRPALLIAVGGVSGTGKSTLSAAIAPHLGPSPGALVLRSDVLRKRLAGASPTERLSAEHYSREATNRAYDNLMADAARVLKAGHAVVLDATFTAAEERGKAAALAESLNVPWHGLWLQADESTLRARLNTRTDDASDAGITVLKSQLAAKSDAPPPEGGWHTINAAYPPDATMRAAMNALLAGA